MVRPERFELEAFCGRERSAFGGARARSRNPEPGFGEGSQLFSPSAEQWCARRDSNLRRFAGVSGAPLAEREPAAEILSPVLAKDLNSSHHPQNNGAPGEIRT